MKGPPILLTTLIFCITNLLSDLINGESCRGKEPRRIILSNDGESGNITDGDEAINSVHCEWLIERNESSLTGASVSITFTQLATECSFDYVFVQEIEDTGNSRLIGALSGLRDNVTMTSSSGKLHIHMFSDTNFFLKGFKATYKVSKCPNSCSGHGKCLQDGAGNYYCECQRYPKYVGSDCSFRQCAEKCWQHKSQGECTVVKTDISRQWCSCRGKNIGETCSLNLEEGGEDIWYRLHSHKPWEFAGRMSSAAVYVKSNSDSDDNAIYIYGGFNLSSILSEFLFYDFEQNQWRPVNVATHNGLNPPPLMGHTLTAVTVNGNYELVMIGGRSGEFPNNHSREIYYFNTGDRIWRVLPQKGPDVAWHTANLVGKCHIYIVGGRMSNYSYNEEVHILDWCQNDKRWQFNVRVYGLKTTVLQLAGHSTVYVERYRSLFIFGGFTPVSIKSSERSDRLFVLNTDKMFLSEWSTGNQTEAARPPSMAYHTAVVLGNYMVIFGGTAYSHKRERGFGADDMCYRNELYFLHLDCVLWTDKANLSPSEKANERIKYLIMDIKDLLRKEMQTDKSMFAFEDAKSKFDDISHYERGPPLSPNDQRALDTLYDHLSIQSRPPSKRYGHVMLNLTNNVLVIIGGFDGTAMGDMYAFKVSELVVPAGGSGSGSSSSPCTKVNNERECLGHPECAWCRNKNNMGIDSCLHRNSHPLKICGSEENFDRSYCPGVCSALTDCQSCALWGSGQPNQVSCGWCSHAHKCMPKEEISKCIKQAEIEQWRGFLDLNVDPMTKRVPFIDTFDACQKAENFRGIILEEHQFPRNGIYPHGIYFLPKVERNDSFALEKLKLSKSFWDSAINANNEDAYILFNTSLNVSFQANDRDKKFRLLGTTSRLSQTITVSNEQAYVDAAKCIGDSSVENIVCLTPMQEAYSNVKVNFEQMLHPLALNGKDFKFQLSLKLSGVENSLAVIPSSYVFAPETWSVDECNAQKSCFACLRNAACGWFSSRDRPAVARCYHKSATTLTLTITPQHCVNCSDFTNCLSCVDRDNNGQCIWWQNPGNSMKVDTARCIERPPEGHEILGNNPTNANECFEPCIKRRNCSACTASSQIASHCAWCNDPPVCFPFQSYLTSFPYGSCKSWVDAKSPDVDEQCKDCSQHSTCDSCTNQYGCGFCYYKSGEGMCVSGGFLPDSADQNAFCHSRLNGVKAKFNYTYSVCPEKNCKGRDDYCEAPKTCEKSKSNPGKYECACRKGTTWKEATLQCKETCNPSCVHGGCVNDTVCECKQGYTGKDCSIDCGCNMRANCTKVGVCGPCVEGYWGSKCQFCSEMFFRNKTGQCEKCRCNDHGTGCNEKGECSCVNNTIGRNCEKCDESYYGDPRNGGICYKGCSSGQAVLTNTEGIIYLGSKGGSEITNAKNVSSCIWKITHKKQAGLQDKQPSFIPKMVLTITRINVMCNYQFVNVYDGEPSNMNGLSGDTGGLDDSPSAMQTPSGSSTSKLLGSFCGRTTSDQTPERVVIADTGAMTIVFNTKKREGTGINSLQFFEAEHTVLTEPCPDKEHFKVTSGAGSTGGSVCTCANGWGGSLCRVRLCDDSAGRPCANNGVCQPNGLCDCKPQYWGENCTEHSETKLARFNLEYDDLLEDTESNSDKARSGHSMVAVGSQIFIIGGYLAKSATSPPRIMTFNSIKRSLSFFTNAGLHNNIHYSLSAAALVQVEKQDPSVGTVRKVDAVYIYGGFGSGLSISGSMQVQYLSSKSGSMPDSAAGTLADSSLSMNYVEVPSWVPKLVGHTMTAAELGRDIEHSVLLIIGGYSPDEGYNNMTILYHVQRNEFVPLQIKGDFPLGIYCHSTVFYKFSKAFYVYGGLLYDTWGSQKVDLSRVLFIVTIQNYGNDLSQWQATWTIVKPRDSRNPPKMMLHKSVIVNNYMLVLGGRTHDHDFTNKTFIYQFTCNTWLIPDINLPSDSFVNLGLWEPVVGHDAVALKNKVYIFGGFNGRYLSRVVSLEMPTDICNLMSRRDEYAEDSIAAERCWKVSGCMYCPLEKQSCVQYKENSFNCKPNPNNRIKNVCHSTALSTAVRLKPACEQLTSCNECLSPDPFLKSASPCVWCKKCQVQRCMSATLSCSSLNVNCRGSLESDYQIFTNQQSCPEQSVCVASTCSQCVAVNERLKLLEAQKANGNPTPECIFTQNARSESHFEGAKQVINSRPIFDWSCQKYYTNIVTKNDLDFGGSSTLETCPKRCSEYLDCKSCLDAPGGSDSGWRSCFWATGLDRCISPTFEPVLCLDGVCDMVVRGSAEQCPKPCESFSRCIDCVNMRHCGYCSLQSSNPEIGGRGICLAGNLDGPNSEGGRCTSDSVISAFIQERDESANSGSRGGYGPPIGQLPGEFDGLSGHQWGYQSCSDENECRNGHHDCDLDREECKDCKRDKESCHLGYLCLCKEKYKRNNTNNICEPQCDPACGPHGTCSAPDVCDCDFGFAGETCMEECQCNGNSNCDIEKTSESPKYCTKCLFSTNSESSKCDKCNATYYGVATNTKVLPERRCKSCLDLCNNKTSICHFTNKLSDVSPLTVVNFVESVSNKGPSSDDPSELECYGCSDNTEGLHCEKCRAGFRKKKQIGSLFTCVLCNCNFHGANNNSCNENDGSQCRCQGHTRSPDGCDSDATCRISKQCSLCDNRDGNGDYAGTGIDGQQCYRRMSSAPFQPHNTFSINPDNAVYTQHSPEKGLSPGEAAFFFVVPRYRNVNIRITVEVTSGQVDVYLTQNSKIIRLRSSSQETPSVDQISLIDPLNDKVQFSKMGPVAESKSKEIDTLEDEEKPAVRLRRSVIKVVASEESDKQAVNSKENRVDDTETAKPSSEKQIQVADDETIHFYRANQTNGKRELFVRLEYENSILYGLNISGRLVIELPHEKFLFNKDKFYIAIHNANSEMTASGIIYQQQLHNSWRVIHIITILCVAFILTVFVTIAVYFLYMRLSQPAGFVNPNRHGRNLYSAASQFGSGSPFVPCDFLFSEYNFQPQPVSTIIPKTGKSAQRYFTVDSRMKNKYTPSVIGYQIFKKNEKMRVATVLFELPGKSFNLCFGSAVISVCEKFPIIETIPNTPSMTINNRKNNTIGNPMASSLPFVGNNTICNSTITPPIQHATMSHVFDNHPLKKGGQQKVPATLTVELPPIRGSSPSRAQPLHHPQFQTSMFMTPQQAMMPQAGQQGPGFHPSSLSGTLQDAKKPKRKGQTSNFQHFPDTPTGIGRSVGPGGKSGFNATPSPKNVFARLPKEP
ncbi:multiple epidermal growth factor-like domains protein 8 isoform X4 [Convolutriloba macropyga]|uniref:multiple epidermal growth factor-like domains protein 8 isoform X4 n=1 Tax=Convolutriloba macropyga TaxID=536237 RepID=UPI003F51CE4E